MRKTHPLKRRGGRRAANTSAHPHTFRQLFAARFDRPKLRRIWRAHCTCRRKPTLAFDRLLLGLVYHVLMGTGTLQEADAGTAVDEPAGCEGVSVAGVGGVVRAALGRGDHGQGIESGDAGRRFAGQLHGRDGGAGDRGVAVGPGGVGGSALRSGGPGRGGRVAREFSKGVAIGAGVVDAAGDRGGHSHGAAGAGIGDADVGACDGVGDARASGTKLSASGAAARGLVAAAVAGDANGKARYAMKSSRIRAVQESQLDMNGLAELQRRRQFQGDQSRLFRRRFPVQGTARLSDAPRGTLDKESSVSARRSGSDTIATRRRRWSAV